MYGLDIALKEFVNQIPSCLQGDSLEQILEVALSGKSEAIAILNSQNYPVGIINCDSLLNLLTKYCDDRSTVAIGCDASANYIDGNIVAGEFVAPLTTKFNHRRIAALDKSKPVTLELNTLIKPAITFSDQNTIAELLSQLPSTHSLNENLTYLITTSQGQLLGKLNITKVLQHLWLNSQKNQQKPLTPGLDNYLVNFLEAIDLPLKIQTATDQVLYKNSCWRKLFREASSASQPIAQWWLEQQSDIDSQNVSIPPSESFCLKNKVNFNSLSALSSSFQVDRECELADVPLSNRHEAKISLIESDSKRLKDHDYIQIPLNLNNKESIISQSSDLKLILAVPAPISQSDLNSSQDAELIELNRLKGLISIAESLQTFEMMRYTLQHLCKCLHIYHYINFLYQYI